MRRVFVGVAHKATMSMSMAKGCPLVLRVALVHGFLNLLGLLRGLAWALTQGALGLVRRMDVEGKMQLKLNITKHLRVDQRGLAPKKFLNNRSKPVGRMNRRRLGSLKRRGCDGLGVVDSHQTQSSLKGIFLRHVERTNPLFSISI